MEAIYKRVLAEVHSDGSDLGAINMYIAVEEVQCHEQSSVTTQKSVTKEVNFLVSTFACKITECLRLRVTHTDVHS